MKTYPCRACGAPIHFVRTFGGKSIPCDPELITYWERPKAPGKIVTPNGIVVSCDFEGELDKATGLGYRSHFATCPEADRFRKSGRT